MPSTYDTIATQTLGSTSASVTFSSISSTFTDLVLVVSGPSVDTGGYGIRVNGDSGTNYGRIYLYGDGGGVYVAAGGGANSIFHGPDGALKMGIHNFSNYSNTTTFKTVLSRSGNTPSYGTVLFGSTWRNTSAITSINVFNTGGFASGCVFSLYGIKAA